MTKVPHLNHTETVSPSITGMDDEVFEPVHQAIEQAHRARHGMDDPSATVLSRPSALRVAILRALHQLLDTPLVFEDRLALGILGAEGEACICSDPSRFDLPRFQRFRASMVVRSRFTEDEWAKARQSGVRQYVILGAGLDTFAYRNPDHGNCRVFEVDLPAMMQWKRECLRMAGVEEPEELTFVTTDFEHASVAKALTKAGFDRHAPAFFSCLGVIMYLDEEAIKHMLRLVGSLAPGSGIVFDYAVHPDCLPPREQQTMERLDKRMAERGEPWKTHLDPASLAEMLRALGFTDVEDLGPEQMNDRYLSGRTDGLRKSGLTRLVRARV